MRTSTLCVSVMPLDPLTLCRSHGMPASMKPRRQLPPTWSWPQCKVRTYGAMKIPAVESANRSASHQVIPLLRCSRPSDSSSRARVIARLSSSNNELRLKT